MLLYGFYTGRTKSDNVLLMLCNRGMQYFIVIQLNKRKKGEGRKWWTTIHIQNNASTMNYTGSKIHQKCETDTLMGGLNATLRTTASDHLLTSLPLSSDYQLFFLFVFWNTILWYIFIYIYIWMKERKRQLLNNRKSWGPLLAGRENRRFIVIGSRENGQ